VRDGRTHEIYWVQLGNFVLFDDLKLDLYGETCTLNTAKFCSETRIASRPMPQRPGTVTRNGQRLLYRVDHRLLEAPNNLLVNCV
jgi:hypothetical protein